MKYRSPVLAPHWRTHAIPRYVIFFQDKASTEAAFTVDNWYRSGDVGRFDADGFLTIMGRTKEIIITSGGKNIAPVPIENSIKKEFADLIR